LPGVGKKCRVASELASRAAKFAGWRCVGERTIGAGSDGCVAPPPPLLWCIQTFPILCSRAVHNQPATGDARMPILYRVHYTTLDVAGQVYVAYTEPFDDRLDALHDVALDVAGSPMGTYVATCHLMAEVYADWPTDNDCITSIGVDGGASLALLVNETADVIRTARAEWIAGGNA